MESEKLRNEMIKDVTKFELEEYQDVLDQLNYIFLTTFLTISNAS